MTTVRETPMVGTRILGRRAGTRKKRMPTRGIQHLADEAVLKSVWRKRLRTGLRKMPLKEFQLGHDALEYLAIDWELDQTVANLSEEVRSGNYRAEAAEVVRAAKSVGLTRPLAFIPPRDLMVYIAVVQLVENELLQQMEPWVRFGRSQSKKEDGGNQAESGWFRLWLRRQDQIWVITSSHEWVVESDIANFFASMSIESIGDHLNNSTEAELPLVNLFIHLLRQFSPMRNFRPSRIGGLPQENFDGSRVVAHTFLRPLDEAFLPEGKGGRYSRWVDDLVLGANDWPEALQIVGRLQKALERLDLFPNSSKTRIIRRREFTHEYMKVENDYIGEVQEQVDTIGHPRDPKRLRRKIQAHARSTENRKAWERVLRRYYTLSKRLGEDSLLRWWDTHLQRAPGSAPQVFEYLTTFRLTRARLRKLVRLLEGFGGIYEDIELLAREYVLMAGNVDSRPLRTEVSHWALECVKVHLHKNPRLAAASALVLAKYGYSDALDELEALFRSEMSTDSAVRRQTAVILYSLARLDDASLLELLHDASQTTSQHVRFLRALSSGEQRAVKMALSTAQPVDRPYPTRWDMRPRPMMLIPLLAKAQASRWHALGPQWERHLRSNARRLHDAAALRWATGELNEIVTP